LGPGQLSIVGFDDIFGSDLMTPSLTTIRSPLNSVGEAAVVSLIGEVEGREPSAAEPLPTQFIARESTAAAS
jgi:LacI family transcriptional regulator